MQKKKSLIQVDKVEYEGELRDIFSKAGVGVWAIEMDEGEPPRLYYDAIAMEFMGMDPLCSPEEQYKIWEAGVLPSAMASVNASVQEMIQIGQSENTYPWIHAEKGLIYIRCGGALDRSYKKEIRVRGYHQEITDYILELERQKISLEEQNARVDAFCSIYFTTWEVDVCKKELVLIQEPEYMKVGGQNLKGDFQTAIERFTRDFVCASYQEELRQALELEHIIQELERHEVFCVEYKGVYQGWCRIVIVPERKAADETITHLLAGIQGIEEEKKQELAAIENQSIMLALCEEYQYVYYADLDADIYEIKKSNGARPGIEFNTNSYSAAIRRYAELYVKSEYQDSFIRETNRENLMAYLDKHDTRTIKYETEPNADAQTNFVVYIVKVDDGSGHHMAIIGFRCVDEMVRQEEEQKKCLEAALAEAKKANAAKSMFLSRMSHDIRTPLNGIIGLIELNERHADDRKLVEENYAKAKVAAHHLLSLLNDILEISKLDDQNISLAHEPFNILELASEVLTIADMRATEAGIHLIHEDCSQKLYMPYVYGSPLHVRQIFLNIFDNAIKYNKPDGRVTCRAELEQMDGNRVIYKCVISDTGIGMSEEFLEHIYEPFVQEHYDEQSVYQGTGLGMPIVKSLIDKMNGTIKVQSEKNVGTTFEITIPFDVASEAEVHQGTCTNAEADIRDIKILLVEDNELNMEIAGYLLRDAGAVVTEVRNGQQAVEAFENHEAGTYDVILMDIMMPVMDGLTAARTIRKENRKDAQTIPIIAMTANAYAEDVQMVRDAGMNAHLAKPLDSKTVLRTIAAYCGKH